MAYKVYLNKILFPVTPQKITIKIKNQNKTYNLINQGEVNVLKSAGLSEIELELLLPNVKYSWAMYQGGFKKASYYLNQLEKLKKKKKKFQFIVTRSLPRGSLDDTNIKVTLEDYTIKEDAKSYGYDVVVSVKLKQYKKWGTKTVTVTPKTQTATPTETRETDATKNDPTTYTVGKGDCLWNIAKKVYGNGAEYTKIYEANKDKIKNPNLIYDGQELIIPPPGQLV